PPGPDHPSESPDAEKKRTNLEDFCACAAKRNRESLHPEQIDARFRHYSLQRKRQQRDSACGPAAIGQQGLGGYKVCSIKISALISVQPTYSFISRDAVLCLTSLRWWPSRAKPSKYWKSAKRPAAWWAAHRATLWPSGRCATVSSPTSKLPK